jgi:hypothetical protein
VEDSLAQLAINFYNALEATFAAPNFSVPVGDAQTAKQAAAAAQKKPGRNGKEGT